MGIEAEGDRVLKHQEIVQLADAVAASSGIATGIGTNRYGAQLIVQAAGVTMRLWSFVARSEGGPGSKCPHGVVLAPARYVTFRGNVASAGWRSSPMQQDVITRLLNVKTVAKSRPHAGHDPVEVGSGQPRADGEGRNAPHGRRPSTPSPPPASSLRRFPAPPAAVTTGLQPGGHVAATPAPDSRNMENIGGLTRSAITVLIPAHNEAQDIGTTIKSVQSQSRQPDAIAVVCDNCTDNTAEVARGYGVRVLFSVRNAGRKAGAMNQALAILLPELADDDLVVCMDADTIIEHDMLRNAERLFWRQPRLGAVSSNHLIEYKRTAIELLQAMEYERDRRMIGRRKGRYGCMTGMAAMYRVRAMRDVIAAHGSVYRRHELDRGLEAYDRA